MPVLPSTCKGERDAPALLKSTIISFVLSTFREVVVSALNLTISCWWWAPRLWCHHQIWWYGCSALVNGNAVMGQQCVHEWYLICLLVVILLNTNYLNMWPNLRRRAPQTCITQITNSHAGLWGSAGSGLFSLLGNPALVSSNNHWASRLVLTSLNMDGAHSSILTPLCVAGVQKYPNVKGNYTFHPSNG